MRFPFLLSALVASVVLAASATATSSRQGIPASVACSSGGVSAKLSWGFNCLRAGESCKTANSEYHRFGYACPAGRLIRARGVAVHANTSTAPSAANCSSSYVGACLNPNASDYDCTGGSGDGPYYTGPVRVVGPDVFGLDRDGDGYACE